jgi:neutral ceramidase
MGQRNVLKLLVVLVCSLCWESAIGAQGTLRVGAARVDITPPADPAHPPSGKYAHEKLYVRAIVLDNGWARAALIAADQGGISEVIWQAASKQIADELNCPVANILMSATHTHSGWGPGGFPSMRGLRPDPNAPPPPIVGQILEATRQAKANLQPARVGFGTGKSYLNVNRDAIDSDSHLWTQAPNLEGPSDKTVAVVEFLAASGQPTAVYMDYAMHPVNGFLAGITSADFAGAASRYVEQAFDDKMVAVFVQGASGDQNPLYLRAGTNAMASQSGVPVTGYVMTREPIEAPIRDGKVKTSPVDPKVEEVLERVMDSEGILLGEEVIRVMTNVKQLHAAPTIAAAQKTVTCPGRKRTDSGREGMAGTYEDGDPVNIRLGVIRIANIEVTSVDAEIYSPIAQRLKRESPMANTFMVTLANGAANSGYVPNDTAFGAQTFQVLGSRLKPGCAETAIVNGLLELMATIQK